MAAGSIVVDLVMRTGSFESDTARASKSLKKFQKDAEAAGRAIGLAFTGAVFGLGYLVKSTIDAQDHLGDLSKKTGIAADTLGGIGFAAQQSGGDLDSVAAAAGKLNKSLAEAAAGNKEASEAFKLLGISVKDAAGNTKTADVALTEIATKFASYADGPEKAALALRIFGKAGADIIPLLNEGGKALQDQIAYFKRYSGVTVETAKAADEFNDTLTKIKLLSGAFATQVTSELLPTLKAIAEAFLAAKESGDGFSQMAGTIGSVFRGIVVAGAYVIDTFGGVGREIGAIAAQLNALAHFDIKGFKAISQAVTEDGERAKKELDAFVNKVLNPSGTAAAFGDTTSGRKNKAPPLSGGGAGADTAEAELKKKLDGLLRSIRSATDQQQSALAFHNRFLEGEYQDGLVSLANFFDDQSNIRKRALAIQLEEQDKIIAAEQAFQKATSNPASRIDAQNKIDDARLTKTKLIVQAGQEEQLALQQNARDVIALGKAFEGVNAQVLDLKENFSAAAAIKFDLQFDALSKTFTANGNQAGLEAIATLRAGAIAQAAFQKASIDSGRAFDDLSRKEEYLALAQQSGAATSLETLVKLGEVRKSQIPMLEARVQAEEAIARAAKAAGNIGGDKLVADAEQARLALEKLKATLDPLGDQFREVFTHSATDALGDFVTGTKSASEAFKSFTNSVLNDILRMGSKSIAESLFGKGGIDAGGFLSSLFSSSGSTGNVQGIGDKYNGNAASTSAGILSKVFGTTSGDSGSTAAKTAETAAVGANTTAMTALTAAAGAAAQALATIAPSRTADAFTSGATPLSVDTTSGGGIDVVGHGFNAAKDSQRAYEDLARSQDELSAATAAQTTAATFSTSAFSQATNALGSLGGAAGFAAQALRLIQSASSSSADWLGKLFGGSGGSTAAASSSFVDYGAFFHAGGVVGSTHDVRAVPAGTFANAPRYHMGGVAVSHGVAGLAHNEVPAILMRSEEVLRKDDPRHQDNLTPEIRLAIAKAEHSYAPQIHVATPSFSARLPDSQAFAALPLRGAEAPFAPSAAPTMAVRALAALRDVRADAPAAEALATVAAASLPSSASVASFFADGGTGQPGKWVGEPVFGGKTGLTAHPNQTIGKASRVPDALQQPRPIFDSGFIPPSATAFLHDPYIESLGTPALTQRAEESVAEHFVGLPIDLTTSTHRKDAIARTKWADGSGESANQDPIEPQHPRRRRSEAFARDYAKFAGFFAEGGYIPPNTWGVTGERGPERTYGGKTGVTVQPSPAGSPTIIQNFTIQGAPASRETQQQIGAAALSGAQRALARNG